MASTLWPRLSEHATAYIAILQGSFVEQTWTTSASRSEKWSTNNSTPALIIGVGGASREALYALSVRLSCSITYVLNRDNGEVVDLLRDAPRLPSPPSFVHVTILQQAKDLDTPYYEVGTVPDIKSSTEAHLLIRTYLEEFLSPPHKGVLLDMWFTPRKTRTILLAHSMGSFTVEGTHVIRYQIEEQWRLWAGDEKVKQLDREGAWHFLL